MKFGELNPSIIAHSLTSGHGFMIGYCPTDIFGEIATGPEDYILVDFIAGTCFGAKPSPALAQAISRYAESLNDLCQRHGTSATAFREPTARYSRDWRGEHIMVTIQNLEGRRSTDEYIGSAGKRVMVLDELGRMRPKRHEAE